MHVAVAPRDDRGGRGHSRDGQLVRQRVSLLVTGLNNHVTTKGPVSSCPRPHWHPCPNNHPHRRLRTRSGLPQRTQSLVDGVLEETGRVQQRNRLLPARLVVYFVLAMCLFSGQSYEEVARLLTTGLPGALRWRGSWVVPSTAAIWKARSRLGVAPLRQLFTRVCCPVATPDTQGVFCRGWRLAAIGGTTFDLPDTKANVEAFGRPPRSGRGEQDVGHPQLRMVGLVECGTHAVFDAAMGALRTGEQTLARAVLVSLRPGMLLVGLR
nr:transposase domain-containing protein [Streptomyces malaysiensis]